MTILEEDAAGPDTMASPQTPPNRNAELDISVPRSRSESVVSNTNPFWSSPPNDRMSTYGGPSIPRGRAMSVSVSAKRFEVMARFLHQRLQSNKWMEEYHENMFYGTANLGAFVRRPDGSYARTTQNPAVLNAVQAMGSQVAFTMSSDSVSVLLESLMDGVTQLPFTDGTSLQIVQSIQDVPSLDATEIAGLGHYAILCKDEHFILTGAASPPELINMGTSLEGHLVTTIWGATTLTVPQMPTSDSASMISSLGHTRSVSTPLHGGGLMSMGFDSSSQLNLDFDQSYMSNNDHIYASNNSIRNSLTPQTPRTPSQAQITPPREQPASHVSLQARRKAISAAMAQLSVQRSTSVDGQPQTVRQSLLSPRPPLRLRNPRKRPTSDGPLSPSSLHGQSIYSIPSSPTYPQAGPHGQQMNIDDVMRTGSGEYFTRMPDQRPSDVAAFASRNMSMMDMKGQGQSPGRDRERRSRSHNRESMESDQGSHFGLERSASVGSTSRRSGVMSPPALYRQASLSNFDIVHEGAEEESVADLPRFPGSSHKFSSHRRLGSANSSYLGASFQGSISHDVEKMIQFVEHAMEIEAEGEVDVERQRDQKRPFMLVHAVSIAGAAALVMLLQMLAVSKLLGETRLDGGYIRFLLLLSVPFFGVFSLFFMVVICGSFFQLFGPLGFLQQNTVYYSSKAPKLAEHAGETLPHLTVQMPVYKEGLKGVIIPTITSVLKAVNYYEAHGGSATVLVADDGMQLVSEELQEARKVYYELHDIAWVARPKQCTKPGPNFFLRKGKFKKASNLNYALDFSSRVEDEFLRQLEIRAEEQECTVEDLTVDEEDELLEMARQIVEESDGGRTWSYGDVRIGEFILLIDSDTVVPETCLLAGALEMIESPEVAIIQHSSGVMNQTHNTFENGIHYFTDLIYTSISHAVGAGDVGPFVGHNAFLRWKAIQSVAFQEDGRTKFWSENHVSEDFDVSLRLQMAHFIVRMAGYHNNQFKEGVSLTVYDELARWEKYAYGCNELIFHPLIYWPTRGIFTPLFLKFLRSNVKVTSKFTIIAYIGTYYAIGVGFPLSTMNYFLAGWKFNLDHYYQTSWNIFVGLACVYNILSPISFAMLRYRMGQTSYIRALGECAKWTPLFMLFFGGLSFHVLKAITCHFFSINIEWTTTAKELEKTGFKIGLDRVIKDFWHMYIFLAPMVIAMVYLGVYAPRGYKITDFTAITPLANLLACHALLPFVLGLF